MGRVAGYYGDWSMTFRDAGNEYSSFSGTAIAIDGDDNSSNLGAQQGLWATFISATNALVLGNPSKRSYYVTQDIAAALPTNGAARETKLMVIYQCTATGKRYNMTLPTLNPTIPLYVDNISVKDAVRTDSPSTITAFIAAFNAFVVAPDIPSNGDGVYATNPACTVVGLRVVGRNI